MYISSVIDFIKSLVPYDKSDTYIGMLKDLKYTSGFDFNKNIKDILKNYNNYYICIYFVGDYHKLYDYAHIDISHLLVKNYYRCILISNENYMLYKLSNI